MKPVIKKYSDKELDNCRFLHLIIGTSGLNNPKENQVIDYSNACEKCKAGRQFVLPLIIPQNSMGKKKIDQNGRFGFLIFENDLTEKIIDLKLNGIEFKNAQLGTNSCDFKVGIIKSELPKMSQKSIVKKFQVCDICGRSGHYSNYDKVDEFWYLKTELDKAGKDFYRTWEYFGIWDMGQNLQSIIISQKVRQLLKNCKLRHLKYEPIFEEE